MSSPRASNVLEIVGDHLGSPEAQVRRNVATALATIGSPESIRRLVDLAVLDPDASVRSRAVDELLELDAEAGQAAAERAGELLFERPEPGSGDGREAESAMEITIQGRANDLLAAFRCQGIAVALPPLPFIDRFALSWKIRRHLMRRPAPPLWRPLLLAFVGALLGAGVNAWWFWTASPELGRHVFLALCLPAAVLSSLLTTAVSRTSVPADHYCDRRMGILVETVGVLWRPVGKLWQSLAVPLIMAIIITAGMVPLKIGFDGLGARLVDYLTWILLGMLILALIQMTMRAIAAAPSRLGLVGSTVTGGIAGAVFGALAMAGAIWGWTSHAGVAIVVSEGLFFLLPLATGFVCERLLSPMVPARRRLSRVEAWTPVALAIVVLP
ncbi:MAG: HEAT repeat domain-containing protein, partial [Thermoanaerobaculia bacterium]